MNFLGHAVLSGNDPEIMTGNMIGDHVKGRLALSNYPTLIRKGIELHRKIDEFADNHPSTRRAKITFRADYGLYSGAIMDTITDHFLANDPIMFPSEAELLAFTKIVYENIESNRAYLPEHFASSFEHMRAHNWLYNYRTLAGVNKSLNGLARRAKYMPPPEKAYELFVTNFYILNQCYFELMDDLTAFVKIEMEK